MNLARRSVGSSVSVTVFVTSWTAPNFRPMKESVATAGASFASSFAGSFQPVSPTLYDCAYSLVVVWRTLPSMSMFVRVSRRCSVTRLPFVVIELSTKVRDTLPLSLVTTDEAAVFDVMSFFSPALATP